ncbi:MAG: DUF3352 domain-containing protein [Bacteroidales bacterium]|nr:MAG: DUF3352 domain-containing protein [Bacteroidales bacterium]
MKKLILVFITSILILSISIYFLFYRQQGETDSAYDAVGAIPVDASFLLKINNYHRFSVNLRTQSRIWESIKPFTAVSKADSMLAFIDTLTNRSATFNLLVTVNPIYISTHIGGNGGNEFFSCVNTSKGFDKKELSSIVNGFVNKGVRINKYEFEDVTISTFIDSYRSVEILSFTLFKGIIICSSSKSLIESSIHQIKGNSSLIGNSSFSAIFQTAGTKVDANLFINNTKLPLALQHFANELYQDKIITLKDIAQWSELDISLKTDEVFLNGFTQALDTTNAYLKLLAHQLPVENKIASILPSETAFFICLGISNLDQYLDDYRLYLNKADRILEYTSALSDYNQAVGFNVHELYRSFFLEEFALVYTAFDGIDYKDCWYIAAKTKGQSQTKQSFIDALDTYVKTNNLRKSDYKLSLKIDNEKSVDIFRVPIKGINSVLFGSLFSNASDEYFTFIDEYIIFGASKEALSKFILANIRNNLLQLDVSYRQFSNLLASESNFFVYLNPRKSANLFTNYLATQYSSALLDQSSALNKIQGIAIQLNGGSSMIFNNISIQYSPYFSEDPQTAWETRLDTVFTIQPQLVVNHITKNQEILVQDVKNKVYLLNEVGRIIWTKQLPEPILGDITQVDLLKNKKLQYIFNTKSFIFAIDRRGSFVQGYPIKLKSKATNSIAIFDYDGSRDYRLFVACEDLRIYSYDNDGKSIKGWKFGKTEKKVSKKLQYFRVKGKDYIVFADKNRPYIVNRKGEGRVSFPRFFSKSLNSQFILDESSNVKLDRLVTTDSIGLIKYIYFNGRIEELAIKAFSSDHVFDYQDIDNDGKKEFIFLDKGQLYVYKHNKELLFLYKFDAEMYPTILHFDLTKSAHYMGFCSPSSKKVFLINGNGSLYNGFPLKGCSLFSIGKFSGSGVTFNLLTSSSRGMLLNYSVK